MAGRPICAVQQEHVTLAAAQPGLGLVIIYVPVATLPR